MRRGEALKLGVDWLFTQNVMAKFDVWEEMLRMRLSPEGRFEQRIRFANKVGV